MGVQIRKKEKTSSLKASNWTTAFGSALFTLGFILALGSYNPRDPSLNTFSSTWKAPTNVLGYLGSWVADMFFQTLGHSAWIVPGLLFVGLLRWLLSNEKNAPLFHARFWAAGALLLSASTLFFDLYTSQGASKLGYPPQGLVGVGLAAVTKPLLGNVGAYLSCAVLLWCFCLVWWEALPAYFVQAVVWLSKNSARISVKLGVGLFNNVFPKDFVQKLRLSKSLTSATKVNPSFEKITTSVAHETSAVNGTPAFESKIQSVASGDAQATGVSPALQAPLIREKAIDPAPKNPTPPKAPSRPASWSLPPLALLDYSKKKVKELTQAQLLETARKITSALKSFEIEGEVVEISPGPIITMYEFQPAPGVRVQRIVAASTDLAMNLGVPSVRIVAPIPGKSVAGIEVPNTDRQEIVLRDVFEATVDKAKSLKLPLVIGRDGEGAPVVEDLSRMPHLLIGGATAQGKSVLMNSILTSLLCRFTPDDLRLLIVDPKLVEFKAFEDIPHLLLPIVNDPSDASQALKWAVSETKRRYVLMQKYSAKNLETYNAKIATLTPEEGQTPPERFSYIVIIVDELAELMMTAKKDVEQSIVRLTQLARAAGIHLIMATQRPSADIVTGLIKSNCPSRASMKVASASDSRIILDCGGAEQLLGRGDMFFTNTGPMGLRRLQSAYVSDAEVEKVGDFWRNQGEPEYKDEILAPDSLDEQTAAVDGTGRDALFVEVVEFAKDKGKISTSLIQRKFQIGYTRAARIMEQLEEAGIVGAQAAAGQARDVNV